MSKQITVRGINTYQPTWAAFPNAFPRLKSKIRGWTTGSYGGPHHPIYRTGKVGPTPVPLVEYPSSASTGPGILAQKQPLKNLLKKVRRRRRVRGRTFMREFRRDVGGPPRIL